MQNNPEQIAALQTIADAITNRNNTSDWWPELGRASLESAAGSISITGLPPRNYLKLVIRILNPSTSMSINIRFNNDASANYSSRYSVGGAADSTVINQTSGALVTSTGALIQHHICEFVNFPTTGKVGFFRNARGGTTPSSAPARDEGAINWANSTDAINRIDIIASTGTLGTNSEIVVLGHD